MKIPFSYIIRNFLKRRQTSVITVLGIGLVVFVFVAVLMMANGIKQTLVTTGSDRNILVSRKSSQGEISSIIDRDAANIIATMPGIAKNAEGKPMLSAEPVVVINLFKKEGGMSNVTVRGVAPEVFSVRQQVKVREGRLFKFGSRELVVGSSINKNFAGTKIGDKVKFAGDMWTIVGISDAGGSGFDSEMWGDADQLLNAFNRSAYSTMTFRMADGASLDAFKTQFAREARLQYFEPKIEQKYYEEQSELMATFISVLGIFITVIFSAGATIGAMITMYTAVANRTVEIGTLRALGFQRRSILSAFLMEALLLSFFGGILGIFLASFLQFLKISTMNFASFSELEFSFALSPDIIVTSLIFAIAMGFFGGFLPSFRASRLKIVNALRSA
jgi:ABC-type antimicrobial peptide transport system permease subunit